MEDPEGVEHAVSFLIVEGFAPESVCFGVEDAGLEAVFGDIELIDEADAHDVGVDFLFADGESGVPELDASGVAEFFAGHGEEFTEGETLFNGGRVFEAFDDGGDPREAVIFLEGDAGFDARLGLFCDGEGAVGELGDEEGGGDAFALRLFCVGFELLNEGSVGVDEGLDAAGVVFEPLYLAVDPGEALSVVLIFAEACGAELVDGFELGAEFSGEAGVFFAAGAGEVRGYGYQGEGDDAPEPSAFIIHQRGSPGLCRPWFRPRDGAYY